MDPISELQKLYRKFEPPRATKQPFRIDFGCGQLSQFALRQAVLQLGH